MTGTVLVFCIALVTACAQNACSGFVACPKSSSGQRQSWVQAQQSRTHIPYRTSPCYSQTSSSPNKEIISSEESAFVSTLVRERASARWDGEYERADELRDKIYSIPLPEGFHIVIKDLPRSHGGGSEWELVRRNSVSAGLSVLQLSHAALGLAMVSSEQNCNVPLSKMEAIVQDAKSRLENHRGSVYHELSGRKAADAAFWFALAGVSDESLFRLLMGVCRQELERFGARASCRAKDIWQLLERLTLAGTLDDGSLQNIYSLAENLLDQKRSKPITQVERREHLLYFHSDRCLLTLWKFSARGQKHNAFLLSALKRWESYDDVGYNADQAIYRRTTFHNWTEIFTDPTLPLVVDIGCGMGVSLLGMARCTEDTTSWLGNLSEYNMAGVDLSGLSVGYAQGLAHRWGLDGKHFYSVASAEDFVRCVHESYPGPVKLCLIQFPTPFRLTPRSGDKHMQEKGNSRLPMDAFNGFMVSEVLLKLIHKALPCGDDVTCGKLLIQSNCEDVAVWIRHVACNNCSFRALSYFDESFDQRDVVLDRMPKRTLDWIAMGGERAQGPVWSSRPFLPRITASETEVACIKNGTPIHRCLLAPENHELI